MTSRARPWSPTALAALVLVVGLGLTACGGEDAVVDDGSVAAVSGAASARLTEAGVDVVAPQVGAGVDLEAIGTALDDAGLSAVQGTRTDADGLALDPAATAGLLGTVGNQAAAEQGGRRYVVLAFDDVASAVVFAQDAPEIFADAAAEKSRRAYLAGRLVGFYAPGTGGDGATTFADALTALAVEA